MALSDIEKAKTTTDDLELIKQFPDKFRLKEKNWKRGRPPGIKSKPKEKEEVPIPGIKTGIPEKEEWAEVSRIIFDNCKELLTARDDEGRLTCSPALLTAASKLVMESETVFREPDKSNEIDILKKQLNRKRMKRKLKLPETTNPAIKKPSPLNKFGDIGINAKADIISPAVFHKDSVSKDIN